MINFPKYNPIGAVTKSIAANIQQTQPTDSPLPTIGYVGAPRPTGRPVVIEFDSKGVARGGATAGDKWVTKNTESVDAVYKKFVAAHGPLPEDMYLVLVGYVHAGVLTLVDAQLTIHNAPSPYWLSLAVLIDIASNTPNIVVAFETSVYAEVDFNNPSTFIDAVKSANGEVVTIWHPTPAQGTPFLPVLRDPFRIVV